MKYWIITDTHFGHQRMIELCGRPENFSEKILINLNRTVACPDTLIHLGDICIGQDEYWHKELVKWCCSKKWLIKGNHDKRGDTWYLEHGWDFVGNRVWLEKYGRKILLSHKPVEDCGYDINIHGHFHNNDHHTYEPELATIMNKKHKLLAIENTNYMPVSLESLMK